MDTQTLATQVQAYMDENAGKAEVVTALPGMLLLRHFGPSELTPALYEPVICLILQGSKETVLTDNRLTIGPGDSLLVSHDVPVLARITTAKPSEPYLAIVLKLDLSMLRSLYEEVSEAIVEDEVVHSATVQRADSGFIDCLARYLSFAGNAVETKVMAPLVLREIHFRLLMAPHGGMLRQLLRHDSHASKIARAIGRIRRDFRSSMAVPDLAREIGMSASSFHKNFRAITSSTPLQYQKDVRLLEARRLLSDGEYSVATAAFEVGYGSPNQFSREYTRKFGTPPSSDLANAGASG